jgi:hypothetical protein
VRVQNAASNMADYGVKPGWQGDAGSHARAGGVGTETGVGSSRLSSVFERKPRFPDEFEAQPRRRCCTCRSACESRRSVNWRASGQRYSDQRCRLGDGAHPECVLDAMAGLAETPQASISAGLPGVASWLGRKGSRCRPRPLGIEDKVD